MLSRFELRNKTVVNIEVPRLNMLCGWRSPAYAALLRFRTRLATHRSFTASSAGRRAGLHFEEQRFLPKHTQLRSKPLFSSTMCPACSYILVSMR